MRVIPAVIAHTLLSAARQTPLEPAKFSGGNTLFYSGANTVKIEGPRTTSGGVRYVRRRGCRSLDPL